MSVICPVCRSELNPIGHFDLSAPYGQRVPCPICNYPIDLSTGLPAPQRYDGFEIIVYRKPVVAWETVKENAQTVAAKLGQVSSIDAATPDTNYLDQTVQNIVPDATKAIGGAISGAANIAGQGVGSGLQGLFSGLGAPLVIGGVAILLVYLMKE